MNRQDDFTKLVESSAIGRTLADQAGRAGRRSLFQIVSRELVVLCDWLEEQGLEEQRYEVSAWVCRRWRERVIEQWERPLFSMRKLKRPYVTARSVPVGVALEQVRLHGAWFRREVLNGDLEWARRAWARRLRWTRHALAARASERDAARQVRL